MGSHLKDGQNYIDGLPMRISPKFIPPRPVALPVSIDSRTPSELLRIQYDFSFEKHVLETTQKRLQELKHVKEKRKTKSDTSPPVKEIPPSGQCALPLPNVILQPKPKIDIEPQAASSTYKINLSDFENTSSSPFDYMELQTINDLEVLNSVFQGIHTENTSVQTASGATVAKSISFPLPQNSWKEMSDKPPDKVAVEDAPNEVLETPSETTNEVNHLPTSFLKGGSSGYTSLSQVPSVVTSFSPSKKDIAKTSLKGSKSYSDFHTLPDKEVVAEVKERSQTPPSTPTVVPAEEHNLPVEEYILPIEEHILPIEERVLPIEEHAVPNEEYVVPIEEHVLPIEEHVVPIEEHVLPIEEHVLPIEENYFAAERSETKNECPDAYEELDNSSKKFVDSIIEMGFARGQVARAVKHLGMDEKKVIEHLCQIQTLEESGYESWEAEAALHLHDYNREQAKAFLDLVIQFQDLGFEKDAVKKALVQNKNDWNKTIDALLP